MYVNGSMPVPAGSGTPPGRTTGQALGLGRAGSARHREPLVLDGHERARSAYEGRRSQHIHASDLGRESSSGPGSSPHPAAASPPGSLPTRRWSPRTGLTLRAGWSHGATGYRVILGGRATSVPFTPVTTGPLRTTTDNTTTLQPASLPRLRRWRSWPIWLWEQGVAWHG
jgi:hypothetical protein